MRRCAGQRGRRSRGGSKAGLSMVEYVVLLSLVVAVLLTANLFIPGQSSFGFVGNAFVVWYQKVMSVLSLPFP